MNRRSALSALWLLTSCAVFPASAYHVPWDETTSDVTIAQPTACVAGPLTGGGTGADEVIVIGTGDGTDTLLETLTFNADGTTTSLNVAALTDAGAEVFFDPGTPALAWLGDVLGGLDREVAIGGTPRAGAVAGPHPVYVLVSLTSAGTISALAEHEIPGLNVTTVGAMRSLAAIGDLDGNGMIDLAAGFPDANHVEILFLNADGTLLSTHSIAPGVGGFVGSGLDANDEFGYAVSAAPDFDLDDIPDLAVGAPGYGDGVSDDMGAIWLLDLATTGLVHNEYIREAWTIDGGGVAPRGTGRQKAPTEPGGRFGASICQIPEYNGDESTGPVPDGGGGDLLVGAPGIDEPGKLWVDDGIEQDRGVVIMMDVDINGLINQNYWLVLGHRTAGVCAPADEGGGMLGVSAAAVGDVTGDGTADYVILRGEQPNLDDLQFLDMRDANLWNSSASGAVGWDPPGGPDPLLPIAALGVAGSDAPLPATLSSGFKFGSCDPSDDIGACVTLIEDDGIIVAGGRIDICNALEINGATVKIKGTLRSTWGDFQNLHVFGTGSIELTSEGQLIAADNGITMNLIWQLDELVNDGLIHFSEASKTWLTFQGPNPLVNNGEYRLELGLGGIAVWSPDGFHNFGELNAVFANEDGTVNISGSVLRNKPGGVINVFSGTLDVQHTVNDGTIQFWPGSSKRIYESYFFENNPTGQIVFDGGSVLIEGSDVPGLVWNGGSLAGSGGILDVSGNVHATVDLSLDPPHADYSFGHGSAPGVHVFQDLTIEADLHWGGRYTGGGPGQCIVTGPGSIEIEDGGTLFVEDRQEISGLIEAQKPVICRSGGVLTVRESAGRTSASELTLDITDPAGLLIESGGMLRFEPGPDVVGTGGRRYFFGGLLNQGSAVVDIGTSLTIWGEYEFGDTHENQGSIWAMSDLLVRGSSFENHGGVCVYGGTTTISGSDYVQGAGAPGDVFTRIGTGATLQVAPATFVMDGGGLAGGGTLVGTLQHNFGKLGGPVVGNCGPPPSQARGGSVESPTISGSYIQGTGAALFAPIENPGDHFRMDVSGAVALAGSLIVALSDNGGAAPGDSFTVITGNPLSGAFEEFRMEDGSSAADVFDILYGANEVTLVLQDTTSVSAPDLPPAGPAITELAFAGGLRVEGSARLDLAMPAAGRVRVDLYDVRGRRVRQVVDRPLSPGRYSFTAETRDLASGIYFARLEAGFPRASESRVVRLVVVR